LSAEFGGKFGFGRLIRPLCIEAAQTVTQDGERKMALEIIRKKDKSLKSKWWYGRFEIILDATPVTVPRGLLGLNVDHLQVVRAIHVHHFRHR
jgi:hypothetical protein